MDKWIQKDNFTSPQNKATLRQKATNLISSTLPPVKEKVETSWI